MKTSLIILCFLFISIVHCQIACLKQREAYKQLCVLQKEEVETFFNPSFSPWQMITTLRLREDVKEKHKIVIDLPEEFKYEKRSVFEVDCFYNPALIVGSLSLDYNCDVKSITNGEWIKYCLEENGWSISCFFHF